MPDLPDLLVSLPCSGWSFASPPPVSVLLGSTLRRRREGEILIGSVPAKLVAVVQPLTDTTHCNLLSWIRCGLLQPEKYARKLWERRDWWRYVVKPGSAQSSAGSSCESAGGRQGLLLSVAQLGWTRQLQRLAVTVRTEDWGDQRDINKVTVWLSDQIIAGSTQFASLLTLTVPGRAELSPLS